MKVTGTYHVPGRGGVMVALDRRDRLLKPGVSVTDGHKTWFVMAVEAKSTHLFGVGLPCGIQIGKDPPAEGAELTVCPDDRKPWTR